MFAILVLLAICSANAAEWWETANFYQIYPRSFMDSDGDGVGDLRGIQMRLQYIKDLGMDAVWLSPVYKSPMADFGYDIADYRDIHSEFGTMQDFDNLLTECKRLGIKLILDFVPNHTSDEHDWFKRSERGEMPYRDYYIWDAGKKDPYTNLIVPPNNWVSFFRFPTWRWSNMRKQFYLHQFLYKQPDLNYRNPNLVQEMKEVLKFWMGKGVSGFRIDIITALFEKINPNGTYPDEPRTNDPNCGKDDYCYLDHIYTIDQPETYDMAYQWRDTLDEFQATHNSEYKVMMTESYSSVEKVMPFYGNESRNGSNIPFNFEMIKEINAYSTASDYFRLINRTLAALPKGKTTNWVIGNHDQHRAASRMGESRGDLLNIMVQTLPGVAITYQGEELVLTNWPVTWEQTQDPQACNTNPDIYYQNSRDPARTPFPWDSSNMAGFTRGNKTWLPIGEEAKIKNVQVQTTASNSHLKIFKKLVKLRKTSVLMQGGFQMHLMSNVIIYKREQTNGNLVMVILNFAKTSQSVNLRSVFTTLPAQLFVYTSSLDSGLTDNLLVQTNNVTLKADTGAVLIKTIIA